MLSMDGSKVEQRRVASKHFSEKIAKAECIWMRVFRLDVNSRQAWINCSSPRPGLRVRFNGELPDPINSFLVFHSYDFQRRLNQSARLVINKRLLRSSLAAIKPSHERAMNQLKRAEDCTSGGGTLPQCHLHN
jgi:hypothetical protein